MGLLDSLDQDQRITKNRFGSVGPVDRMPLTNTRAGECGLLDATSLSTVLFTFDIGHCVCGSRFLQMGAASQTRRNDRRRLSIPRLKHLLELCILASSQL